MRPSVLLLVVLVGMAAVPYSANGQTSVNVDWKSLIGAVGSAIRSLWRNGSVDFLGHRCTFRVSPYVYRFQLWYKGIVRCPSISSVEGDGRARNTNHAVDYGLRQVLTDVEKKGIFTRKQVEDWLKARNG